jgi:hypothetical protein
MTRWLSSMLIGGLVLVGLACTKSETTTSPRALGEAGESCASRNDCVQGLACIDNRCVKPGTPGHDKDGGMTMAVVDTRGLPGESCTRRADCRTGNACIDNVCVSEAALPAGMVPSSRGDRGESCQARNDCKDGLACITQKCVKSDFMFTAQTKQCFRVQCEADKDCCANFTAPVNCPTLESNCRANMGTDCALFNSQCKCSQSCQANMCTHASACKTDTDCGSTVLHCLNGMCVQCKASTDCTSADQQCVAGVCRAGCVNDEQCPLFSACQSGQCIDVGCKSARECYFATKNPLSECKSSKCITPCDHDAECGDLELCDQGHCLSVGCESDAECRALLGLQNVPGGERAVCREPDH